MMFVLLLSMQIKSALKCLVRVCWVVDILGSLCTTWGAVCILCEQRGYNVLCLWVGWSYLIQFPSLVPAKSRLSNYTKNMLKVPPNPIINTLFSLTLFCIRWLSALWIWILLRRENFAFTASITRLASRDKWANAEALSTYTYFL